MPRNDDADFIRTELEKRLEELLGTYYPGHVVRKGKAYLTPKNAKDLGSFVVNLSGPRRGQWYRHSQKIGGGTVELISYSITNGLTGYAQAFKEARAFLGIEGQVDTESIERSRRESAEKRRRSEQQDAADLARKAETVAGIWSDCRPIAGTLAEKYLLGRGLDVPPGGWPDCLGFHPSLVYDLDEKPKRKFPGLVARVDDVVGDLVAIWRIFLDAATGGKGPVDNSKLGLGPAAGGAIRLGGIGPRIGGAEGVETALAAWGLIGFRRPVWALLSTAGMAGFEIPIEVEHIDIFPDGDRQTRRKDGLFVPEPLAPGRRAANALAARAKAAKVGHTIQPEPPQGSDYLDLYNRLKATEQ